MKEIILSQGQVVLVDDDMYEELNQFKWRYSSGYALCTDNKTLMHRQIMNVTNPQLYVDHINHDCLDNRKENLRVCTNSQNRGNSKKSSNNKSGFKGVTFDKNRKQKSWKAQIGFERKIITIGYFKTAEEAAVAYDIKSKELFGEFVCPNFPDL